MAFCYFLAFQMRSIRLVKDDVRSSCHSHLVETPRVRSSSLEPTLYLWNWDVVICRVIKRSPLLAISPQPFLIWCGAIFLVKIGDSESSIVWPLKMEWLWLNRIPRVVPSQVLVGLICLIFVSVGQWWVSSYLKISWLICIIGGIRIPAVLHVPKIIISYIDVLPLPVLHIVLIRRLISSLIIPNSPDRWVLPRILVRNRAEVIGILEAISLPLSFQIVFNCLRYASVIPLERTGSGDSWHVCSI